MKKVLFFAAALAVVSLTSCGKGDKNAEATDSTANTEVGGVPADTVVTAEGVVTGSVDANGDTIVTAEVATTTEGAK